MMLINKKINNIAQLNVCIVSFESLFDRKPIISIKGNLLTKESVDFFDFHKNYVKIKKTLNENLFLDVKDEDVKITPYYLSDQEYYEITLK